MSKTKITIALPKGGLLSAAAMKRDKDVAVSPGEAIDVPEAYGLSLIDNGFAYKAEKPRPEKDRSAKGDDTIAKRAAAEKAVEEAKEELAKAQEVADKLMNDHWIVKDGILVFDGKGLSLATAKDYGDFELFVDWKIEPKGDSGLYLRGTPQVQIWDTAVPGGNVGSGGLFNNQKNPSKPTEVADKPVGEWNTFWIKMVGDKVTVILNGELVVDNKPLAAYKPFNDKLPEKGPIELQYHGDPLWFKNIYIKELP